MYAWKSYFMIQGGPNYRELQYFFASTNERAPGTKPGSDLYPTRMAHMKTTATFGPIKRNQTNTETDSLM